MEATILNRSFEAIDVIDTYKSFIWVERYDEAGDFEVFTTMEHGPSNSAKKGYYLWNKDSDRLMIIETVGYDSDDEAGDNFTISGRSLESLLERRIIWHKVVFSADDKGNKPNLQNGIARLLFENAIVPTEQQKKDYGVKHPTASVRAIPNLIFKPSTDERITKLDFEAQYLGDDLYKVITNLCRENEIGFKITLTENDQFEFELFAGTDRSYGTEDEPQLLNPYVIFSEKFDNLINTDYIDSDEKLKNVALVVGESEYNEDGEEISRLEYEEGSAVGLDRRETFVDSTSMGLEDETGGIMSADRYRAHLKQKGIDALIENTPVPAFAAEIEPNVMFTYGEDYFIGDIVQITDKYGTEARAYISEYMRSCSESGTAAYPTFKIIQKGAYEE